MWVRSLGPMSRTEGEVSARASKENGRQKMDERMRINKERSELALWPERRSRCEAYSDPESAGGPLTGPTPQTLVDLSRERCTLLSSDHGQSVEVTRRTDASAAREDPGGGACQMKRVMKGVTTNASSRLARSSCC